MSHSRSGAPHRVVLVTGGGGYVGSHAAKALRAEGYQTILFDNLSAGHGEAALGAPLIVGDIGDVTAVRRAIRETRASAVMHFAGRTSAPESVRDPAGYYLHNVAGTLRTLEAMALEGCSRFVFSSSCAVYGDSHEVPLRESSPVEPMSAYGETKLAVERALPHYERAFGIRSVCLRYFNAAGADPDGELGEDHDPETHLIPRAIAAACGGAALEVFGEDYPTPDGTCQRDYVHVMDLADAHVRALHRLERDGGSATYNVGTGRPSSVKEIVRAVERATGRAVPWRSAPRRPGDPAILFACGDRIQTDLGWVPTRTDPDTIVADAWRWHAAHPHGFGGA